MDDGMAEGAGGYRGWDWVCHVLLGPDDPKTQSEWDELLKRREKETQGDQFRQATKRYQDATGKTTPPKPWQKE